MRSELAAAGIRDPALRAAYRWARAENARHGRTYFLATRLLPTARRPAVHALYGFARWVDDIVDQSGQGSDAAGMPASALDADGWARLTGARLDAVETAVRTGLATGRAEHPLLASLVHTARCFAIPASLFEEFLAAMRMDLTVRGYEDRAALDRYMRGSAEVIGLQMLPVLGTLAPLPEAAPYAAALGKAFQLTNFLRDIAEDLDRGRVYLPRDELAAFGVERDLLAWCRRRRHTDARVRAALAYQHAVTRRLYRAAEPGLALLHPASKPCIRTALVLYEEILDEIECCDFAVFARRASVPTSRRLRVAAAGYLAATRARRATAPPEMPDAQRTTPTGTPVGEHGWETVTWTEANT